MAVFDLDEALSGVAKEVAHIQWVSDSKVRIDALALQKDGDKAVVVCDRPHNVSPGDQVYITGFGFQIDGKYEAIAHPTVSNRPKAFLIDRPKRLGEERLSGGLVRRQAEYAVYNPNHLDVSGTMALKELGWEKQANRKAQIKVQGAGERSLVLMSEVQGLADKLKIKNIEADASSGIKEGLRKDAFARAIPTLAELTDDDLISEAIAALKKAFKIKAESFADSAKAIAQKYRDLAAEYDVDPKAFTDAFDKKALELRKREIEILCIMPKGLMDALDYWSNADQVVDSLYAFISKALAEGEPSPKKEEAPKEAPKPQNSKGKSTKKAS